MIVRDNPMENFALQKWWYSLILGCGLTLMPAPESGANAGEVVYTNATGIRYNPLLLGDDFRIGYREKLWNKPSDDLLFGTAHIWGGTNVRFSPAFLSTGLFVTAQPIAILELDAAFARVFTFMDVDDIRDSDLTSPATLDAVNAAGSTVTNGWSGHLQGRLQIKVGDIAARSTAHFRYFNLEGTDGGLFYQQGLDMVTGFESWVLQEDSDILYLANSGRWILGLRYSYTHTFTGGITDTQRLGPLFLYKFHQANPSLAFEDPSLIVLCQWHLAHQFRAGQSMDQAVPYFLVAYTFKGQLSE